MYLIVCFTHVPCFSNKFVFFCRFVCRALSLVICNEDKCCVVTQRAADIRVAWLVYVRTYCVPIATRTRFLYLGDSHKIMQRFCQSVSSGMHGNTMGIGPDLKM